MTDNTDKKTDYTKLAILVPAIISITGILVTGLIQYQEVQLRQKEIDLQAHQVRLGEQEANLKLEELHLKYRQLNDSLDPKVLEGLLDSTKRETAIKLGNGLYLHNDTGAEQWWCNVIKELAPSHQICSQLAKKDGKPMVPSDVLTQVENAMDTMPNKSDN